MTGYIISAGAHYHWVRKIVASTTGSGALKLTLKGDPEAAQLQFNEAEITIFTDDVDLTARLIKAINSVNAERANEMPILMTLQQAEDMTRRSM